MNNDLAFPFTGTSNLPSSNSLCATNYPEPQNELSENRNNNKIRQINIEEVNRGFIVRVGCHNFAISTKKELTNLLTQYISEPDKTEQLWFDGKLFKD